MIVDVSIAKEVRRRARDWIGMRPATSRNEICDAAVLMPLIVVHVAGKDDDSCIQFLLILLQHFGEHVLGRARRVSSAKFLLIRGTRVWRMVENNEHEVDIACDRIEFMPEPLSLCAQRLAERTVKHQEERVRGAHRVVAASAELRKVVEVVIERNVLVAMKIVIAESGINRNFFLAPNASFHVPNVPIIRVRTVVGNVATNADEGRMRICNALNQSPSHRSVRRFSVAGICKARIAVSDEAEGNLYGNM